MLDVDITNSRMTCNLCKDLIKPNECYFNERKKMMYEMSVAPLVKLPLQLNSNLSKRAVFFLEYRVLMFAYWYKCKLLWAVLFWLDTSREGTPNRFLFDVIKMSPLIDTNIFLAIPVPVSFCHTQRTKWTYTLTLVYVLCTVEWLNCIHYNWIFMQMPFKTR